MTSNPNGTLSPLHSQVVAPNPETNINPSVFIIIVILAIVFFVSGLLHLLARCLLRPSGADHEAVGADSGSATALQGQLRQLFHLHDSGVEQSFIDALPVFLYKAVMGVKDPFDCAVCLCEFEPEDRLRLLPKCSHAFHLECIDTWLLSHSTCPLCRASLVGEFSPGCSPRVFVFGSGSEGECGSDREDECRQGVCDNSPKTVDNDDKDNSSPMVMAIDARKNVVMVKLGKLKNVDGGAGGGEGSSIGSANLDARRCFSMGSLEYVMDETSVLQVPIKPSKKKLQTAKPGHRLVMSDCDGNSRRNEFRERNLLRVSEPGESASINYQKRESFSISKIWLRNKKGKGVNGDSFRLALFREASDASKVKDCSSQRTVSELDVSGWSKNGSEFGEWGSDVESGSCNYSIGSQTERAPSFARRTLLWIAGRQNRVVNHV